MAGSVRHTCVNKVLSRSTGTAQEEFCWFSHKSYFLTLYSDQVVQNDIEKTSLEQVKKPKLIHQFKTPFSIVWLEWSSDSIRFDQIRVVILVFPDRFCNHRQNGIFWLLADLSWFCPVLGSLSLSLLLLTSHIMWPLCTRVTSGKAVYPEVFLQVRINWEIFMQKMWN